MREFGTVEEWWTRLWANFIIGLVLSGTWAPQ